jgi:hypothetical protein
MSSLILACNRRFLLKHPHKHVVVLIKLEENIKHSSLALEWVCSRGTHGHPRHKESSLCG